MIRIGPVKAKCPAVLHKEKVTIYTFGFNYYNFFAGAR